MNQPAAEDPSDGNMTPVALNGGAPLRIGHLLRKFNPAEWGGTETAIQRLCDGLRQHQVSSVVYCPGVAGAPLADPLTEVGCTIRRFPALVPIWGVSAEHKRQLISVGGNLMSFQLFGELKREPGLSLIHTHTMGRLGGIALTVAKRRRLPLVITIHGGALDLRIDVQRNFSAPRSGGLEWGKVFGWLFRSRRLLIDADAILTCNPTEAGLLRKRHPAKRILVQPHGVPLHIYDIPHREAALAAYPQIQGRQLLLVVGRIDPVKNQHWVVEHAQAIFRRHPQAFLVLAGACTDEAYGKAIQGRLTESGLAGRVLLTGGLPPNDPRLIGLMQEARAVVLPSLAETFGLVILEAWAAGAAVITSRTSGALALLQHQRNGWLFDLDAPKGFHQGIDQLLRRPEFAAQLAAQGRQLVETAYDSAVVAGRVKDLYQELIEEKHALRHSSR